MEINEMNANDNTEMLDCNVVSTKMPENCRCNELEERSRKAEVRCAELEFELQRKKKDCEALEAKLEVVEVQKFAIENELKVLRKTKEEKEKKPVSCAKEGGLWRKQEGQEICERERRTGLIVDLTGQNEDQDVVLQLMIENNVLECEKKRAESEIEAWKDKFQNLESHVFQLGLGLASLDCHERNGNKEGAEGSNSNKPEENLHLGNSLNFMQNQEKVANLVNVASYCVTPVKEIGDLQSGFVAGTPSNDVCQRSLGLDSKMQPVKKTRKQLTFEPEGNPNKNMALSMPVGGNPAYISVIDIIDSDEEPNTTKSQLLNNQGRGSVSVPTCFTDEKEKISQDRLKQSCDVQNKEEDLNFGEDVPFVATPKRKRTCNVVTSDSESDDDDVPICRLRKKHIQEVDPDQVRRDLNSSLTAACAADEKFTGTVASRRRLQPLRKCVGRIQEDKKSPCRAAKPQQCISTNEDADGEELESESEGESLGGFIVNDSDVSYCKDGSSKSQDASDGDIDSDSSNSQGVPGGDKDSDSSMSQNESNKDMDFSKILSRIKRNKDLKMKWEFEGDMLAAFGKDPELCMKAVCALYRQQTSEEQMSKGALYCNHRGFSKFDASRGCTLAEFLTDGDSVGYLKKSVKELKEYDPKAVELCRTLAIRYSKQLFEIYKNREDPLFP